MISGRGLPVPGADIDTDQIIPARYMKMTSFKGIGKYAFYDLRYNQDGSKKEHPFNASQYQGANILLVNENFGCGSSREHAPQSLHDYGITAIIGESFAEIFAGNCTALGIPAVQVEKEDACNIQQMVETEPNLSMEINLPNKILQIGNKEIPFSMPESYRKALIGGTWDSTRMLIASRNEIEAIYKKIPYITQFAEDK